VAVAVAVVAVVAVAVEHDQLKMMMTSIWYLLATRPI
jgi:hypothetical protein